MKNGFMKLCSIFLVLVLLANMLPLQVFAHQLNTGKTEPIVTAPEPAADENAADRVIAEIKEKRTEFSKEFLLASGLRMVTVYPEAVHYAANTGWEEIDNTLVAKTDGTITNTAGVWNVSFPQQLSKDKSITIEKDGYALSFSMSGELTVGNALIRAIGSAQEETLTTSNMRLSTATTQMPDLTKMRASVKYAEMVPEKVQSQLTYANVYRNTDVIYDLQSNKVKESVILESYRSDLRGYRYTLDVGEMIPVLEEDGQILFYDAKGENIVMVMPAPYLIDDAGARSDDIRVQLTGSGSRYTMTYLLPQQWLAAEDRAWPVVVDPAVCPNLNTSNIRDRSVAERWTPSQTWGYNACGYFNPEGIVRFFLKYENLPKLTSSDVIVNATVQMYKDAGTAPAIPVYVHKVLDIWSSETITWANKPEYDTTIEDYAVVQENRTYFWDVTDICRGWYDDENTGMMFKASDELEMAQVGNYKQFYSSDYGSADTRPILSITFRNNNGLESYWDYSSASAGRAGTGYVNNYTGNLVWVRNDIGFGGNRMPVSINHIYNANDAQYFMDVVGDFNNSNDTSGNAFGLGYGWRTNYNQLVYQWITDIPHNEHYIWEDADGTDHYFKPSSNNTYKDEDGLELTLTVIPVNSQENEYKITDKTGNVSHFDTRGRLIRLENNQQTNSSITIEYVGETYRIATITDGANRKYYFEYQVLGELLTKISYKGGGSEELGYVLFEYDGNKLISVIDQDCEETTYSYYDFNLLKSAQDIDGYKLTYNYNVFEYKKPARIESVESGHNNRNGNKLTFEYDYNLTTLTSYDNAGNAQAAQTMQFNNMGNTVCIQDDEGRAQYAQFAKNDGEDTANKANQLKLSSKLQNTVSNMYDDSSFERNISWTQSADAQASVAANAYYGDKCMQITTTANAAGVYKGTFTVDAGETVTFSAYIKTGSATAFVCISDYSRFYTSEYLQPNNDWTRLEISYTNTTSAAKSICPHILSAGTGTFWVDNIQLERTSTASRYNLVENGNFAYGTSGYTTPSGSSVAATPAGAISQLQGTAIAVSGDPTSQKRVSQTVAVSGNAGDSFVYAAWAKGDSASLWGREYENNTRTFAVEMQFNYTDNTSSDPFAAQFNPDTDQWQYAAGAGVALKDYSSVTVTLCYDYNVNTAYFDGIQLFKEEFGTSYTYDDDGNVISVIDLQKKKTTYEYDNDSNLTRILENNRAKTTYTYDQWNNVETATTDQGQTYRFDYDTYGNNTAVTILTDDSEITTSATYSSDGNRLVSVTDALGKVTTYGYNADTNVLEWVQDPEDTAATRTTYWYDDMYRVASVTTPRDTGNSLWADYYYYNDLLDVLRTPTSFYSFAYGDFGVRTAVYADEDLLAAYTYTDDGNNYLSALDYGNGDRVEYNYDDKGRLTLETFEDGDFVSYTYNSYGNLATVTDSIKISPTETIATTTTYYYDLLDRMVKYRETRGDWSHTVTYEYDMHNNLSALTEDINGVSHTTMYGYDPYYRLFSVDDGPANETYIYDDLGRIDEIVTAHDGQDILTKSYTYKNPSSSTTSTQVATNRIQATISENADDPDPYVYDVTYSYTYDDNGNILSISDGTYTTSYVYDSANQLIRENNQELGMTYAWEYDAAGNITSYRKYIYTTGSVSDYDLVGLQQMSGYGSRNMGDLFTQYDGMAISYDEIGNPLYDSQRTYTWEHGRELTAISEVDYYAWEYTYDANGMRTSRTCEDTEYRYVYNGSQLSQMTVIESWNTSHPVHTLYFTYSADGTPLTMTYEGDIYYYVTNIQGDVIAILDDLGRVVCRYAYDAWGYVNYTEVDENISFYNPLRYRGYVYDEETRLYYLQSRYYNPEWGRFINADGQISGVGEDVLGNNMFAYCFNNPVNLSDSSGNWPTWNQIKTGFKNGVKKLAKAILNPIEAQVGVGMGFGFDVSNNITAEISRDTYFGIDDGKTTTGNVLVSEISIADSELGIGNTYDHRVEENGKRISSSGKSWHGPFDMINYPDVTYGNELALGPLVINDEGDILIAVSASAHFIYGGHVSVAYNVTELIGNILEIFK